MVSDEEGRLERARRSVEAVGIRDLATLAAAQEDVYEAERALARSRQQPYGTSNSSMGGSNSTAASAKSSRAASYIGR